MPGLSSLQNGTSSLSSRIWTSVVSATADQMPSIRTSLYSAFGAAQAALGLMTSPVYRLDNDSGSVACSNPQLSCHNTSVVEDLCCFNSPGGSLLQTQFWDTNPVTGPEDSWTIHGLWPDNCDGTYEANCDDSRAYTNISDILNAFGQQELVDYMNTYWTSIDGSPETFWEHEWSKHGTCISTLDPPCYSTYEPTQEVPDFFSRTVSLFKALPSYQWLKDAKIMPDSSRTYSAADIQAALSKNHNGKEVYLGCRSGELDEIWYFFNTRGSVQSGTFEPAGSLTDSTCPDTGIKYLPKNGGGPAPTITTTGFGPSPTSTSTPGEPFVGKGYLNVVTSGSKKGCIISKGTWYTSGTCASFAASGAADSFTLKSSKGNCAVASGKLTCGADSAATFSSDGSKLVFAGSDTFYADSTPSGSTQVDVYTEDGHDVSLSIEWQGV